METFLIKTLQLIIALTILVALHEGGHCFFAKLFGTRVSRFYIFANWKFHLFSTYDNWFRKLIGKPLVTERNDEGNKIYNEEAGTEYGIGWLPIGGYCQIEGMVDETQSAEKLESTPEQPWEFRAKPAWQRLLIMVGGVLMNFILAFFIYAMILYTWGTDFIPVQNYPQGMYFNERAKNLGFCDGDILQSTEKGKIETRTTGDTYRLLSNAKQVTVLREGREVTIQMPGDLSLLDMIQEVPAFMDVLMEARVDSVMADMPGAAAGLQKGDKILTFNGKSISSYNEFKNEIGRLNDQMLACSSADSLRLRNLTLTVDRAGETDTLNILMTENLKIGFVPVTPQVEPVHLSYGFWESFPAGLGHGWGVLKGYVSDLKYIFTKQGAKSVGGFGSIGAIFPSQWNWERFWELTALLSLILGFMNILPIPGLDGGHVLFLCAEVITGKKPSPKFLGYAQTVGFVLLILLMIWANLNDVIRFLF